MCGLVGMAGDFSFKAKDVLEDLLTVCALRGKHSTGVAGIQTRTNSAHIAKAIGLPANLFEQKSWDKINCYGQNILIGHTRHATRGGVNVTNAHPFQYGTIIGAHNGTLMNERDLEKNLDQDFNTDSQALYAHMNEFGAVDTISEVRGAWALTWYDGEKKTLNLLRNDERPLWYCFSEDCNKIFWASELWMLSGILGREGVKLWHNDKGHSYFQVPIDQWLEFSIPETGQGKVQLIRETTLKGNEPKTQVSSPFRPTHSWPAKPEESEKKREVILLPTSEDRKAFDERLKGIVAKAFPPRDQKPTLTVVGSTTTEPDTKTSPKTTSKDMGSTTPTPSQSLELTSKSDDLDDSIIFGPKGNIITSEEFDKLTRNGCIWCNETIMSADSSIIKWIDDDAALCPSCSGPTSEASQYVMAN